MVKRGSDQLAPEIRVTSETPPTFLVHATNDSSENSALLYLALKRAGVPAELHIYSTGGHGFGMRPGTQPYAAWPQPLRGVAQDARASSSRTRGNEQGTDG